MAHFRDFWPFELILFWKSTDLSWCLFNWKTWILMLHYVWLKNVPPYFHTYDIFCFGSFAPNVTHLAKSLSESEWFKSLSYASPYLEFQNTLLKCQNSIVYSIMASEKESLAVFPFKCITFVLQKVTIVMTREHLWCLNSFSDGLLFEVRFCSHWEQIIPGKTSKGIKWWATISPHIKHNSGIS